MESISVKSVLSARHPSGWFGSDYTANIYRGCCHGCIYCDSRSECYHIEDFERVKAKAKVLELLDQELQRKRHMGIVLTGSMSDPYNPWEQSQLLTRGMLTLLAKYQFGVIIITKSPLVTRDIDLLQQIGQHAPAVVQFTITTADSKLCSIIEPHVPNSQARWQALGQLHQAGITCGVLLTPLLPFINDTEANVTQIVQQTAATGADWLYADQGFCVSLRDRQRQYLYTKFDQYFPGLTAKYRQTFGNRYWCPTPNRQLWHTFTQACQQYHLLYDYVQITNKISTSYPELQPRLC